jgi:hypothetical protein
MKQSVQKLPQLQTDQSSAIKQFHLSAIASLLYIDLVVWLLTIVTQSFENRSNKSLSEGKNGSG